MENITIEICAGSADDAFIAEKAGVTRIELNSSLFLGGLTPSLGTLKLIKDETKLKVLTMVRPRQAGFFYSEAEYKTMLMDARIFIDNGADGIVFGFLNEDGTVDLKRCEPFIKLAGKKDKVFHRAIDVTPDPFKAIDDLISLKFTRILTSGQATTAYEGAPLIAKMVEYARGRIEILPGGGITKNNASRIIKETGVNQIHFASLTRKDEPSTQCNPSIYYGGALYPSETSVEIADLNEIIRVKESIQ